MTIEVAVAMLAVFLASRVLGLFVSCAVLAGYAGVMAYQLRWGDANLRCGCGGPGRIHGSVQNLCGVIRYCGSRPLGVPLRSEEVLEADAIGLSGWARAGDSCRAMLSTSGSRTGNDGWWVHT